MSKLNLLPVTLLSSVLLSTAISAAQPVPAQTKDQALHERLPEEIKKQGKLNAVFYGDNPPHGIINDANKVQLEGASYELSQAVGEILGVKINYHLVKGLPSVLSGIQARRYDISFGPVLDATERQERYDFIDYIKESDALILAKGNPQQIHSLADTCGKRIAVNAGGGSEQLINNYSKECVKQNKAAIIVQSYSDKASCTLAVQSGRADAMLDSLAPASYFVGKSQNQLELVRTGIENVEVYEEFYQGTIVPKGSPLTPILLAAYQRLFENGTYAAIMEKWHIKENMLPAPGVNLATKASE